ncbi:MAG TPA: MarR family transcriptional regulator [Ktedonobacterales bacterium]|jgi:DNA-binding MarR family transcriptional regulator|nr:MarR family transcriptional regulator [Ktedonobacterales bacterium]
MSGRSIAIPAWLRLARVFQKVDRATVDLLRQWDLSVAQFDVLVQVGSAEGLTQQQLADRLLVTKGNVCQLLDRMEERGLLVRQQEGRANHLYLTEKGKGVRAEALPAQEHLIESIFMELPRARQTTLLASLRRLDHTLT